LIDVIGPMLYLELLFIELKESQKNATLLCCDF
jgi:hypothetical protein